ncbi:hypothetical protein [Microbispora hainanensis]|uniref:Uncharacterized protein n=1 Tax=Microbispora hainanensis TaxID=568844 RepID=A0A544YZG5_9ACTN|nr:hypothetical protein [Microbispora hainanensis]TQS22176.1 hypothetical protein FLX08_09360 [Microbispora hainanensis]
MSIQRRLEDFVEAIADILGEEEIPPDRALRPRLRRLLEKELIREEIRNSMADVGVEEDQLFEIASGMLEQIPCEAPDEYDRFCRALGDYQAALSTARRDAADDMWNRVLPRLAAYGGSAGGVILSIGLLAGGLFDVLGALRFVGGLMLLAAALVAIHLRVRKTMTGQRFLFVVTGKRHRKDYTSKREALLSTIVERDLVVPTLRLALNQARVDRLSRRFAVKASPGLGDLHSTLYYVPTPVEREVGELIRQLTGGSIGIAGPRGSGKSSLLGLYCAPRRHASSADICCLVSAPVDYLARDFVLHMFAALCRSVVVKVKRRRRGSLSPGQLFILIVFGIPVNAIFGGMVWFGLHNFSGSPALQTLSAGAIVVGGSVLLLYYGSFGLDLVKRWWRHRADRRLRRAALRNLARIRYLQTHTESWSGTLKASLGTKLGLGLDGQRSRGVSRAEQPLGYPEIVRLFRVFASMTSAHARRQGGRVLIGIDELDKISSADQGEKFLNEIKSIFGVPGVYFLITVSDDALTAFERRGIRLRDAFDSSFDEILRVELLSYRESRRMLYRRVIGLSEPYVALCHALSGGLARDLIRSARHVIRSATEHGKPDEFDSIVRRLVRDDVRRKTGALSQIEAIRNDTALLHVLHRVKVGYYAEKELSDLLHDVRAAWPKNQRKPDSEADLLRRELIAFLYLSMTLEDVFNERLDEDRVRSAADDSHGQCLFDMLASARSALGTNTELAWRLTSEARSAWGLDSWDNEAEWHGPFGLQPSPTL